MQVLSRESVKNVLNECPIWVIWGPTGAGKTHLAATAFNGLDEGEHGLEWPDIFWPALVINADPGGTDTGHEFFHNPKTCELHSLADYDGSDSFTWLVKQGKYAATTNHPLVLLEGLVQYRYEEVSRECINNPAAVERSDTRSMYAPPTTKSVAIFTLFTRMLQRERKRRKIPTLIVITLNSEEQTGKHPDTDKEVKFQRPDTSPKALGRMMRQTSLFVEISRDGRHSRLSTDGDKMCPWRKVRGEQIARSLAQARNPTIPGMLKLFAEKQEARASSTAQVIAQIQATQTAE